MVAISRLLRHLAATRWQVRRAFPAAGLAEITNAIRDCEAQHLGEIRFVVEGSLEFFALWRDQSPRQRALDLFSLMRIWDTEHNNGVLIYLLFADRVVEIVADRGIDARVNAAEWQRICRSMGDRFRKGDFVLGVNEGIAAIGNHLIRHFPVAGDNPNELADQPTVL